ncbi:hypothetical protein M0811_11885 [Anaeramoeba ignava]|uniref:Uncharacterized protein n=1 Tax=Anaeramoeba ignava TaxID=1746090 RepID=A0A9Q0R6L6_ANAIG|nr:hypothetical protein M0811_11885 [Anaeramoeba ignava]
MNFPKLTKETKENRNEASEEQQQQQDLNETDLTEEQFKEIISQRMQKALDNRNKAIEEAYNTYFQAQQKLMHDFLDSIKQFEIEEFLSSLNKK